YDVGTTTIVTPEGHEPDPGVVERCQRVAGETGATLSIGNDLAAVEGAAAVYTDVWASMGQESEADTRKKIFAPYQVNEALMARAGEEAVFLHCLPAHRGEEVTDAVADSPQSVIFQQAENRLHVQKAILLLVLGGI
ncbi:MAG: ornithine carbamoyltransferase, partial [Acidobacteriota bacterium]|nr:ornithine carbamoyltransferase [Acidobacteriota bacterium]